MPQDNDLPDEVREWSKTIGREKPAPKAPSIAPPDTTAGGGAEPTADPGRERRGEIIRQFQAEDPDYPQGREFWRGGAGVATGLARALMPSSTLESLAQRYPIVRQTMEFADDPNQPGFMEAPGQWLARQAGATTALAPVSGPLGALAGGMARGGTAALTSGAAAREAPPIFSRGVGWVASPRGAGLAEDVGRWSARAGRGANVATQGAVGGVAGDPEHPLAGAVTGAAAGGVPMVTSKFLQSAVGKQLGRTLLPTVATGVAIHGLGGGWLGTAGGSLAAHLIISNVRWHSAPMGSTLNIVGEKIFDAAGTHVATIPPWLPGYIASQVQSRFTGGRNAETEQP